MQNSEHKHKSL